MGDDIPHRRPPGIGHPAFVEDLIPVGHRHRLEAFSRIERGGEPAADFGDNARQIPGGDAREPLDGLPFFVHATGRAACPLREAPLIVLEKSPGPVGEDRLEDRLHLVGRSLKRCFETDEPLGIFRGAVAGVGVNARGDRPCRLVPGLGSDCPLLDPGEGLEGRFWFSFVEGTLDGVPLPFAGPVWSGGLGGAAGGVHDQGPAEKDQKPGEDRGDTWQTGHGRRLRGARRGERGAAERRCGAKRRRQRLAMECPGGTRGRGEGVSPPPPLKSKCTRGGPPPSPLAGVRTHPLGGEIERIQVPNEAPSGPG